MIESEQQYRVTQARIEQFRRALADLEKGKRPLKQAAAIREGIEGQLLELEADIAAYEASRGKP